MALYIPRSILHLARLLYVRPETFGPTLVGLPSGPFAPGSSTQTVYAFLLSPILATCLAHLIHLAIIT